MSVVLGVRNTSAVKGCYRADALRRLARTVCAGEGISGDVEISLLFCDDARIQELNCQFRHEDRPTDVLSFGQGQAAPERASRACPAVLGDVVISLETVAGRCGGDSAAARQDVHMLFCHGLLHLLGYDHATAEERRQMAARQARYLELPSRQAWPEDTSKRRRPKAGRAR